MSFLQSLQKANYLKQHHMENEKTNGYVFSFHREKYNWEEIKSFTHEECFEREENETFTEWEEFYNCVDCSDFCPSDIECDYYYRFFPLDGKEYYVYMIDGEPTCTLDNGMECSVCDGFFTIYGPEEDDREPYDSLNVPLNILKKVVEKCEGSKRVTLAEFEELFANEDFPATLVIRDE